MSAAEAHETREGETLSGKYKLERLLGSGGMGEVYRAENKLIGRTVAIKVLRPEFARKADVVARFLQEGRAANLVRHPNVVDVLDVGQDERGTPFIVQEFLHGSDFAKYLEAAGGKLSVEAALETLLPVIDAVALAHSKGVVHRDLKPENVFLAESENDGVVTPKLLDFGISQIAAVPGGMKLTAPGTAMGTPAYMSPEQVLGGATDQRTDVWSLGVILYEALSGELPFTADNPSAYMVKVASTDPRPLYELAQYISPDIARIVGRCLRRDLDARYPTAAELARDLRLALRGGLPEATGERAALRLSNADFGLGARPSQRGMAAISANMPLPELDLDAHELAPVHASMAQNVGLGQVPPAPPPPPSGRPRIQEPEVVLDLDLRPSKSFGPESKPRTRHQRVVPTARPDHTVRNGALYAACVAVAAFALVFLSPKLDVRAALTAAMEFTAELSYWWIRAGLGGIALVAAVVTLYFAIRWRPNSPPLAIAGIGMLGVVAFEGLSALALFGADGGDRALAMPRWYLVAIALFLAGWGVHAGVVAFRALLKEDDARVKGAILTLFAVLVLPVSLEVGTLYAAPQRLLHDPALKEHDRPKVPRPLAKGLERVAPPPAPASTR